MHLLRLLLLHIVAEIDASVKLLHQRSSVLPGEVAAAPEPLLGSLVTSGPNPKPEAAG